MVSVGIQGKSTCNQVAAEPGRPLVWPGQFVMGYNRQNLQDPLVPIAPAALNLVWQKNGSYLVYRRLQQKVHLFWQFCKAGATAGKLTHAFSE